MATPIEERIFEYARGAGSCPPEQVPLVVQQLVDLARGDIEVLHRACWYCEQNLPVRHPEDTSGERVVALLHAAIEKAKETRDSPGE